MKRELLIKEEKNCFLTEKNSRLKICSIGKRRRREIMHNRMQARYERSLRKRKCPLQSPAQGDIINSQLIISPYAGLGIVRSISTVSCARTSLAYGYAHFAPAGLTTVSTPN